MIDLHIHLLPGLDDGPPDWQESLAMCRLLAADGTRIAVATPHTLDGTHNASREAILRCVQELNARLRTADVALKVLPGAEVHAQPYLCDRLRANEVMTLADGGKYILLELSHDVIPPGTGQLAASLRMLGVTPILVHPELHSVVQRHPLALLPFIQAGSLVQITAASITGEQGRHAAACARELLERRLAHLVASDAHGSRGRVPGLSQARDAVAQMIGEAEAVEIFERRPEAILAGRAITAPEPLQKRSGARWRFWPWK